MLFGNSVGQCVEEDMFGQGGGQFWRMADIVGCVFG